MIKLTDIKSTKTGVEIRIRDLIKTSRPGADQPYAFFPFFNDRINLCIARTISFYVNRTKDFRGNTEQLLISFKPPHKQVGAQTVSRWIRTVMHEAGISEEFTAHSTRHASTSKALIKGVDLNTIKRAAGWSKQSRIFANFYNRPVEPQKGSFAEAVFDV